MVMVLRFLYGIGDEIDYDVVCVKVFVVILLGCFLLMFRRRYRSASFDDDNDEN